MGWAQGTGVRGYRALMYDGLSFQTMFVLTSGPFVVGIALLLGASNFLVGVLCAAPFLGQVFQIPAILLVERLNRPKLITTVAASLSRSWLLLFVAVPLFEPATGLNVLLLAIFLSSVSMAFSSCAWGSWVHDLIPRNERGQFFSRRLTWGLAVAMPVSLLAGRLVDMWAGCYPNTAAWGYALVFLVALVIGVSGIIVLQKVPEPSRHQNLLRPSFRATLREPWMDNNFRRALLFAFVWSLAFNLAVPFFTIYMFQRLGLSLTTVVILTVISQSCNVLFLRLWGSLADRFSNKSVMRVSGILLLVSILVWPFTTLPEIHLATIPLLLLVHVFLGVAVAGVSVASFNLGFKLAPAGRASRYLGLHGALVALGMGVGPILGGLIADSLSLVELSLTLKWLHPEQSWVAYLMDFRGLDFLFFAATGVGIYALHRLRGIEETGEAPPQTVYREFVRQMRRTVRNLTTAGGLSWLVYVPLYRYRRKSSKGGGQRPRGST